MNTPESNHPVAPDELSPSLISGAGPDLPLELRPSARHREALRRERERAEALPAPVAWDAAAEDGAS